MPLDAVVALFLFAALMVFTPGPANILLMTAGARWGLAPCLPFIAGVTVGKLLLNIALAFGLLALLTAHPLIETGMRYASAVYLLWLAWKIARTTLGGGKATAQIPGFAAGLIVHPLNPKAWAMLTAAYAQFTNPQQAWGGQVAVVCAAFFLMQSLAHPLWCWGGAGLARFAGGRAATMIMWLLAALMAAVVVWSLARAR